ncbi:MAG: hypothetical protein DME22_24005 [Verrucomicrobia bacterium]|nr:MAG: hypothetical protein DME22_24005 [Verrucomicrobiota bacterium]
MSYRCPKCNGIIYDRRNYLCAVCGAELPARLLFLPPEMVDLDKVAGGAEIPVDLLAQTLLELRKARGNLQRESVFSQVGYSGKESREFLEILKEKYPVQDLGLNDATTAG